jgi:hypothetical protein
MLLPKQVSIRVSVPFRLDEEVGLGEVIKRMTATVGVTPCAPCEARAAAMDRMIVFSGRRSQSH